MKPVLATASLFAATCLMPVAAHADLKDTIAARQKIFGLEHVNSATGDLP